MIVAKDGEAAALPRNKLTAVCMNQRGDTLATSDSRGMLTLFRLTKNRYVQLKNLGCAVTCMQFSPLRKSELAVATRDGAIYIFDTDAQRLLATLKNAHKHGVTSISFHPRNAIMITSSVDAINIWDLKKWTKLKTLGAGSGIADAKFNAAGTSLLVAFRDDSIISWSTGSYEVQGKYDLPKMERPFSIQCMCASSDGKYLLVGGQSSDMYIWETDSKQLVAAIELPPSVTFVVNATFLPDNKSAAVLGDDGRMLFMQVAPTTTTHLAEGSSAKLDMELARKRAAIVGFALDVSCKYCSAILSDGSVILYDIQVARKFNGKVREATLRMGSTAEEVDVSFPMHNPNLPRSERPKMPVPEPPCVVVLPKYPRPEPAVASPESVLAEEPREESVDYALPTAQEKILPEESQVAEKQRNGIDVQPAASMESRLLASGSTLPSTVEQYNNPPVPLQKPSSTILNEVFGANTEPSNNKSLVPKKKKKKKKPRAMANAIALAADPGVVQKRLSRPRLISLLRNYGQYPDKYRLLIWGFLLQLPRNETAFDRLLSRGIHPNYAKLSEEYPIKDQRLLRKLQKMLSALANWSPVFSNLSYLPAMAFPIVKVFASDGIGAFETLMSFVLNWCEGWFETFPHPPIPVLAYVERLMAYHDKPLLDNFVARGIDARVYAWRIMRTLFTELLSREEWLQLFDHFLTHADEPTLLPIAVVAYLRQFRSSIIGSGSAEEIEAFLHRQNPISMEGFIKSVYKLRADTPNDMIPGKTEASAANFPLGVGQYPIFDRYPKYVVNFQLQERKRIEEEENRIRKKRSTLEGLQRRADDLGKRERDWQIQQAEFLRLEKERVAKLSVDAQTRAKERERLARKAEERRMQQVAFLQESAERALDYQKQALEIAKSRGELESKVKTEEQSQLLKEREKEEELLNLEFQSMQQVHEIQQKRKTDDDLEKLQAEFDAMQKQTELVQQRAMRDMKLDDERRATMLKARTDELAKRSGDLEVERVRRELMAKQAKDQIEYEANMAEAERERRLRAAQLDGTFAADEEIEMKRRRQRILMEEEEREQKLMAMELKRWRDEQQSKRMALVEAEEQRLKREKEARDERLRQLESLQRKREFEEAIIRRKSAEGASIQEEEKRLQEILSNIEKERATDRKEELDLLFKEQELREKSAFNKILRETDEKIVAEERERFERIRAHYRNVAATTDEQSIRVHEAQLKDQVAARQQEIIDRAAETRAQVRQEEIAKLKEEFGPDADRIIAKAAQMERKKKKSGGWSLGKVLGGKKSKSRK
jgi:hypothetical protein